MGKLTILNSISVFSMIVIILFYFSFELIVFFFFAIRFQKFKTVGCWIHEEASQ